MIKQFWSIKYIIIAISIIIISAGLTFLAYYYFKSKSLNNQIKPIANTDEGPDADAKPIPIDSLPPQDSTAQSNIVIEDTSVPTDQGVLASIPGSSIRIVGDENCIQKTNQALNLLNQKAKAHYNLTNQLLAIVQCVEKGSAVYAWEKLFKVGVETLNSDPIWYASGLAHEACHVKQYNEYYYEKKDTPYIGEQAEAQCLNAQYDALEKLGADQRTLDYVKNSINTEYWNVKYEDRWW